MNIYDNIRKLIEKLMQKEREAERAYILDRIKEMSDKKEHKTNNHYLGYEEAIDDIINLFKKL